MNDIERAVRRDGQPPRGARGARATSDAGTRRPRDETMERGPVERARAGEPPATQGSPRRFERPAVVHAVPTPERGMPVRERSAPIPQRSAPVPGRSVPVPERAVGSIPERTAPMPERIAPVPRSAGLASRAATPPPPVCVLPTAELDAAGYLTPSTPKNALTEQYRRIKRPLLRNLEGADAATDVLPNVIMVTSSVEGEGKTYTALNLAMSLALERDRTVLLVDADVIKGSASRRLGMPDGARGLIDLLVDDTLDAGAVITRTDVPDLRVLPAGGTDERATELLSSGAMSALVRELSTRYADRIIVLDCPPMLAATEASAIAAHVGQVVFVVAEGTTAQADVDEALSRFDEERFVGVLMNKAQGRVGKAYKYGYA